MGRNLANCSGKRKQGRIRKIRYSVCRTEPRREKLHETWPYFYVWVFAAVVIGGILASLFITKLS